MSRPVSNLNALLQTMEPHLHEGVYAYCALAHGTDTAALKPIVSVLEREALTVVIPEAQAQQQGLSMLFRCAWITLSVHSDLEAVGLTAAFASALGAAGISCNVVAGAYHDHIFVPFEKANAAIEALRALQARS